MSSLSSLLLNDLPQTPLCVGYSGGLDSTVLLHALVASRPAHGLRAWHVHHGLHPHADEWAAHCEAVCAALGVALTVTRVTVARDGEGLEAAARRARHAAFAAALGKGEVLALAHHRDDQAETFLLRALRASGPDALGAMRPWRALGRGRLWRPLLAVPRAALETYATTHGLRWIDDPSNTDTALDRNFLRHRVLPLLRERWPHADAAFARSAGLCGEAAGLLEIEDAQALAAVRSGEPEVLQVAALARLPAARRARVLRRWIGELGLPPLPATGIARIETDLLHARADADAAFVWAGAVVRRWRGWLHADVVCAPLAADFEAVWDGREALRLPGGDSIGLQAFAGAASAAKGSCDAGEGPIAAYAAPTRSLRTVAFDSPLHVHARRGGERIRLPGRAHSHALKQVLQDLGVPPWRRERLPLLLSPQGELLAAGDLVCSAGFATWLDEHDVRLCWHRDDTRPPRD